MTIYDIYTRQSIDVGEGIERQIARCTQLIEARGGQVGTVYRDNDTSATKERGAGTDWARMLADTARPLVAVDLDRLLRTTSDLNTLMKSGRRVVTVDGEIDLTTADGEFRGTMLAAIARFEVQRKSERQRRANEHRVANGLPSTKPRFRPFGYADDGVQIVATEAEAIRDGYEAVIAGSSLASVARRWNEAGFETSQGNEWAAGSVSLVLSSPRYMGQVVYKREAAGKAVWEPIVDEATWRAARAMLRVGTTGKPLAGRTLLGMLARCGVCDDGTLVRGGSNNGRRSYRCNGPVQHLSRAALPLEDYVERIVKARLAQGDIASRLAPGPDDNTEVLAAIEQTRGRLDALAIEFADGALTTSQLRLATERLRNRLDQLEGQLAASRRGHEFADLLVVGAERALEAWQSRDVDAKRRVIDALMVVTVGPAPRGRHAFDPATVQIEWRGSEATRPTARKGAAVSG